MSAAMNRTQGNNRAANPKIWGLMEETKMESTNRAFTGQLNNSHNSTISHLTNTLAVMAMGAMLTASADNASKPLAKEQAVMIANWDAYADARDIHPKLDQVDSDFDAYIDARDIQISGSGLNFSGKLVSGNSGAVGKWDVYADARDIR